MISWEHAFLETRLHKNYHYDDSDRTMGEMAINKVVCLLLVGV